MEEDSITFRGALLIAWWPFSKCISGVQIVLTPVLRLVLVLLSPIWAVASLGGFLLLPLVHLAKGLLNIVTFPLQVKWLERIETVYIFLGTAGLIGCMTGAVLYLIFNLLSSSLNIDGSFKLKSRKSRTTADFRIEQREKKEEMLSGHSSSHRVISDRGPAAKRRGLLSQTIAEEEDSDL